MSKPNKKKKPLVPSSETITIGNISGGTGIAIGTEAQATVTQIAIQKDDPIAIAFKPIKQAVIVMPDSPHREAARTVVENLEAEARKGDQADESKVQKWINFLAEIAPDVWEIAIDTFANPVLGVGTVFKKIAEMARRTKAKIG